MSNQPLNLAILWHMHQPFYKDLVTGEYILPWARLHAVKDYYDMVAILDRFPEVKMTFNLVPSLLNQVEDYVNNKVSDKFLDLTLKAPNDLSLDNKVFILQNFFLANWDIMIHPYPRYQDLLLKRGRFISPAELPKIARRFSNQELLDLQVWFNLTWFGFISKTEDPVIKGLIAKGKYFSAEDKALVISKQLEVMGKVIPKYKELSARGQIELTTTPYYHPILPLLCDSSLAKEAMPGVRLPKTNFHHPEDALEQIKMAVAFHRERFGSDPAGMWPSEGSVAPAIIPLIAKSGIKWIATDEAILERSLRRGLLAEDLYQPYTAEHEGSEVAMIFRNHFISDQVGFVYYRWKINDALADFSGHCNNIRLSLPEDGNKYLLSVILDGENAWEFYPGGGKEFLEAFYQRLSSEQMIKTVTVSEHLEQFPPRRKLSRLFAGSWINNNFKIWIGHEEDNKAWDLLNSARLALENATGLAEEDKKTAWQEIYIAEGSDWYWWYGDDHSSENDAVFDALFRKHLKNVYSLIGRPAPKELSQAIKHVRVVRPIKEPVHLVHPILDGEVTNYYEWLSAGHFDIGKASGAMHQIETLVSDLYYGFSLESFFIRLDLNLYPLAEEAKTLSYAILIHAHDDFKAELLAGVFTLSKKGAKGEWVKIKNLETFSLRRIIEFGFLFADLDLKPNEKLEFTVVIYKDGQELERWPRGGGIGVTVPSESYSDEQWYV
ncbi:MAG: glycoside hydrolase family 57 protein [bacterium]